MCPFQTTWTTVYLNAIQIHIVHHVDKIPDDLTDGTTVEELTLVQSLSDEGLVEGNIQHIWPHGNIYGPMVTSMQQPQQDKEADSSVTFDNFTAMETSVQRHSSDEFVPNLSSMQITNNMYTVASYSADTTQQVVVSPPATPMS